MPVDGDPGEVNLVKIADACGTRPETCPWRCLGHPFVREVLSAHRHWNKGAMSVADMPHALRTGVEAYDAALNSIENTDRRADREEQERERKKREAEPPSRPTPRSRRR